MRAFVDLCLRNSIWYCLFLFVGYKSLSRKYIRAAVFCGGEGEGGKVIGWGKEECVAQCLRPLGQRFVALATKLLFHVMTRET